MKKFLAIIIILLLASAAMFAQDDAQIDVSEASEPAPAVEPAGGGGGGGFLFGFKVGLGMARIIETYDNDAFETQRTDPIFSWCFGGRIGYFAGMIGFLAEVEYIKKGGSDTDYWTYEAKWHLHYIDINLMFALKAGPLLAGLGIYTGFRIYSSYERNGVEQNTSEYYKSNTFGLILHVGAMFGGPMKFEIGLDFKYSIIDILKETYSGYGSTLRNVNVLLTFSLMFGS